MRVLLIGGTGLISTGIVRHLLARGATVDMFNRGRRENTLPPGVRQVTGDRKDRDAFDRQFADARYDVVIDMIAFTPADAEQDVRAFGGRCEQLVFCSTVCTYGVKVPPRVLIDESFPQEPVSGYGRDKVACEQVLLRAHEQGRFRTTIVRPSHTYGPGSPLIDNLQFDPVTWDRIARGRPVLCSGDGLGLWVSTHRDDVGKLFAHACLNPATYGQAYNATRDEHFTWRDYYREAARALGTTAQVLFVPAGWLLRQAPDRFGFVREISGWHGAYTSDKAKRDVPGFRCEVDFATGARETLEDVRRRNAWRADESDPGYQQLVDRAVAMGIEPATA